MEQFKISTNLELNTVTLSDVANDTTGDMKDTKMDLDSENGIKKDASQSLSDQSQGEISNTHIKLQSKISRETSFENTTSESATVSANSSCIAIETVHETHPGSVNCDEVEDAGLETISIAVSSDSIKHTKSEGNININSLHINLPVKCV